MNYTCVTGCLVQQSKEVGILKTILSSPRRLLRKKCVFGIVRRHSCFCSLVYFVK